MWGVFEAQDVVGQRAIEFLDMVLMVATQPEQLETVWSSGVTPSEWSDLPAFQILWRHVQQLPHQYESEDRLNRVLQNVRSFAQQALRKQEVTATEALTVLEERLGPARISLNFAVVCATCGQRTPMLHRITLPDAACQAICAHILSFERHVLAFACNATTTLPLTEAAIKAELGPAGDWFWQQLHVQRGQNRGAKNNLHRALEAFIKFVQATPACSQTIIEAFDHDIKFPDYIDDPSFQFSCRTVLDEATRSALKPLLVAFYEDLMYAGFPECVHGRSEKFDRDAFMRRFWLANPDLNVCPACDDQRPDSIGTKNYSHADHYLPKADYSFLSVHPANLVPVCGDCNSLFKGTHDPVDKAEDAPLVNIFLPYHRAALDFVTVQAGRETGPLQFTVLDNDGSRSRRVENLVETYKLEKRWQSRSRYVTDSVRETLSGQRRIMLRFGQALERADFGLELEQMAEDKRIRIRKCANYVLHASYLQFAAADKAESEELYRQFLGE